MERILATVEISSALEKNLPEETQRKNVLYTRVYVWVRV